MIVFLRIDERLIHGQIAMAWTKTLSVTHIVVANDEIIGEELQKTALKMAAPADVKTAVKNINDAIELLRDERLINKRVMVIVKRPKDALRIVKVIPGIPFVNVGNCGFLGDTAGVKDYIKYIRLSDADLASLKEIQTIVPVELQVVPDSAKKTLKSILEGEK
jgi:PTS system mannose-specific IIB component